MRGGESEAISRQNNLLERRKETEKEKVKFWARNSFGGEGQENSVEALVETAIKDGQVWFCRRSAQGEGRQSQNVGQSCGESGGGKNIEEASYTFNDRSLKSGV